MSDDPSLGSWPPEPPGEPPSPPPAPPTAPATPPPAGPPPAVPTGLAPTRRRRRFTPLQSGLIVVLGLGVAFAYRVVPLLLLGEGEPRGAPGPLPSEEVCTLLTPDDLDAVYGPSFDAPAPSPFSGLGICDWHRGTRGPELDLEVRSVDPRILGLSVGSGRPSREYVEQAFESSQRTGDEVVTADGGWDEAVFQEVEPDGTGYADRLLLRTDDVVLQFDVTGEEEPVGGRDDLVAVAAAAVAALSEEG